MLKQISIQNYALIENLAINFSNGFTTITGETGAGKSILIGALSLILGERADAQTLNDKSKKCVVEGVFDIKEHKLHDFFERHELDYQPETLIRREINSAGVSRAFINDTPVNLAQLKALGIKLIDIHSQHETLELNDAEFQLSVVDAYAGHSDLLRDYKKSFREYKLLRQQLNELTQKETQSKKDIDYWQFQFNELEVANLIVDEQEKIENELETLNNAEEIKSNLSKASKSLDGGEMNLLSSLSEVRTILSAISKYSPAIDELTKRLNSSYIELKDIAMEIEKLEENIVFNPSRTEELTTKLDEIYRLQKKHNVQTTSELLVLKDELSKKLLEVSSMEEQIVKFKSEVNKKEKLLLQKAKQISKSRGKAVPEIEKEISNMLKLLGMPNGILKIENRKIDDVEITINGLDKIIFLFSANKGGDYKELNKVASGGELSRVMLSIKSLIAKLTALPVIIFDEIDTGVSGDVADKVGNIMMEMAEAMQVIAITHLPQIASKGEVQLFVYKEDSGNKTVTKIKKLNKEERVMEIAKMLSNENPTSAAIKNAKELLKA